MLRANQNTGGHDNGRTDSGWREFFRLLEFRDRNGDLGVLHRQSHIAQTDLLTCAEPCFFHRFVIDESPVGGTAIAQQHAFGGKNQFAMRRGNRRMIDLKIAIGTAPHAICAEAQIERSIFETIHLDEKFGHNCCLSQRDLAPAGQKSRVDSIITNK